MKHISDLVASFEKKLAMILMFFMAVVVTLAVIFRYIFNDPLVWAGETSVFLLVAISFLGGSLGLKYKSQAAVTIVIDFVPEQVRKWLLILGHVLMLTFLVVFLFYSYKWIFSPSVAIQKSSAMLLPMWIPYSSVPIGLSFATIHLFANLLDLVRGGESK
ncbi:TRAP transporter small permease [Ammoniphilus sp. CFH 90114]|uniref:TRAP transporter small permease n=1 Tax=Ammoniphilus sp. CFH 90114 TaxID=2493665 RepID=UPI00100DE31E|nr:TRAP transporter small permease [Ammoniphilus sp. CFH 90114]RXT13484.1 TRAP transporter small permease [Ammoniphilus sp. CFH 90114]